MNAPFYIGQEVVCVNDKNIKHIHRFSSIPVEGKKYTIRGMIAPDNYSPTWGVYLEEILGSFSEYFGCEYAFYASRFRPIDKIDQEIEIMRKNIISGNFKDIIENEENPYKILEEEFV